MAQAAKGGGGRRGKRDAVLDAAARQLNARGMSQSSLSEIAAALGIGRAALYYYVEDREDLVFQCYRRACEAMARDLDAAIKAPGRGLDRLEAYVRLALNTERPEPAVLAEVAALPSPQRETIEGLHHGNVALLTDLIEAGQGDGSIRPCHSLVAAQAVIGIVSWIPLAQRWTNEPEAELRAEALAGALALITGGIAVDPEAAMDFHPLDIAVLRAAPGNLFDREDAQAMKLEALLAAASRLFNRKGVEATSVDEIAAEVGATKGVVYHYLADKPDLVAACYRRAFTLADRVLAAVEQTQADAIQRALAGLRLLVEANLRDEFCPLAPLAGVDALTPADRVEIIARVSRLHHGFPDAIRDGGMEGTVRDVPLTGVSLAMAGAFGWLHKWFSPEIVDAGTVVDEHVRLLAGGLKARTAA